MEDQGGPVSVDELPWHVILGILTSGRLSALDLVYLELTSRVFGGIQGVYPLKFRSLVDLAAFQLCGLHRIYASMSLDAKEAVLGKCGGNWKRVLRFLQSIEEANGIVHTTAGNVFTCGDNASFCCGQQDTGRLIFRPKLVEALHGILYKQVCAGKRKTFILSDAGRVYGFGWMGFGSLGFPDKGASDKIARPRVLDSLWGHHISQVSTGLYPTVVITNRGKMFGFGDNERAQLGHDMLRCCPRPTEIFIEDTTDQCGVVQENA